MRLRERQITQNRTATPVPQERIGARKSRPSISPLAMRTPGRVQPKLTVNPPGDRYEQEADRVADQVMRMPGNTLRRQSDDRVVQTQPLASQITPLVQQQRKNEVSSDIGKIESTIRSRQGDGQTLPESTLDLMESKFGVDFSNVRVHRDPGTIQINKLIGAQAFTFGNDIYYGANNYPGDNKLTAHELTHVVQQTEGINSKLGVSQLTQMQRQAQPQQNQPQQNQVDLQVEIEITGNIVDNGHIVGMRGTQTITYTDANGNVTNEVQNNVEWREDNTVEGALLYEHPAAPAQFNIVQGNRRQRYPIQTTHPEGGIAIHAPGRSEGCILAGRAIRNDIQNRLNNNENLSGQITRVRDSRTLRDQNLAPLPY
jgi:hypothetical protein